jgi:beta-glucosidase
VTMLTALKNEFGNNIEYVQVPNNEQIKSADIVLVSVGTNDSEGWDKPFNLPDSTDKRIAEIAQINPNTVVIVSSGSGIQMTNWNEKVKGIVYAWYSGQNGNVALAEILSGKTNPSGKLPISIEKKFEDSPGANYIPKGESLYVNWDGDMDFKRPIHNIEYKEGVFVGYRWYESKNIEPLYHFGFGLSYTSFEYSDIKVSSAEVTKDGELTVSFTVKNIGKVAGAEVAQLYIQDVQASVPRPVKELKGFKKVFLNAGESKEVSIHLSEKDFAYWDVNKKGWYAEPGDFNLLVGASSNDIRQTLKVVFK